MKPVKLADFLSRTRTLKRLHGVFDLTRIGMLHAAPKEGDRTILRLRFDPKTGRLLPAA